jgi:hypothetical protein
MKKLLFLFLGLAFINTASAQLSISKDTAFINLEPQSQVKGLINVLNPNEVKYNWTLVRDDIKPNFSFIEMCDCKDCFGNKAYPTGDSCIAGSGQVKTFSVEVLAGDTIEDGFFIVEVENASDPTDKASLVFMIRSAPNSLNDRMNDDRKVSIQPNPSDGLFRIATKEFESALVYDITGNLVFEADDAEFDLSHLPKGLYLLEVNADQVRSSHKITLR